MRIGLCLASALVIGALAAPAAASPAAPDALPAPPTPQELVTMTNALGSVELVPQALLAAKNSPRSATNISVSIPVGGQDPLPICSPRPGMVYVLPSAKNATGFQVSLGELTESAVDQIVYSYPTPQQAQTAWAKVVRDMRKCPGSYRMGDERRTVRVGRWGSGQASASMFVQTDVSGSTKGGSGSYLTVMLVDSFIQMVNATPGGAVTTAVQRASVRELSTTLATRLMEWATLPVTQNLLLTAAETAMLTASDIPASTAVTQPAQGGWFSFNAYDPSPVGPMTCNNTPVRIPAGFASFVADVGGDGGPAPMPGGMAQSLEVYPTVQVAKRAWRAFTAAVAGCTEGASTAISSTKSIMRQTNGVSALAFDGTPGVWSRELSTYPDGPFTSKNYTIHLLVGSAIQSVTYYAATEAIGSFRLDQVAVNTLAEELANRWVSQPK